jgi:glucosamine-6-phosphate deaminase
MRPTVYPDAERLGQAVATWIADGIELAAAEGRSYVLGCPAGRSGLTTYAALAGLVGARRLDLSRLIIAMMDEYVEPMAGSAGYAAVDVDAPHSCRRFARERIVDPLSAAAGRGRRIADVHVWMPDPADPAAYDGWIEAVGGVDLFILASGASDGHVAFNPPGTPADSRTRIVELPESTRLDNLATFPALGSLDRVPRHGVTVGIDTIRRWSATAVMVAHGTDKQTAAARLVAAERYDPEWPATVITECGEPRLCLDPAAAPELVSPHSRLRANRG